VEHNVSEIGDCRIGEEQGPIFTTVLRIIIRTISCEYGYNNATCVVLPIKSRSRWGQQWSCSLQITRKAAMLIRNPRVLRKIPPTLAPAV